MTGWKALIVIFIHTQFILLFDAPVHSLSLSFSLSARLPHRPHPANARDDRNCLYMRPFTFSIRLLCDAIYLFYYCILNMLRIDKIYVCVWMNGPYLYIYVFDYRPSTIIVVCAFAFTVCCVCVTGWFIHSFWSHFAFEHYFLSRTHSIRCRSQIFIITIMGDTSITGFSDGVHYAADICHLHLCNTYWIKIVRQLLSLHIHTHMLSLSRMMLVFTNLKYVNGIEWMLVDAWK